MLAQRQLPSVLRLFVLAVLLCLVAACSSPDDAASGDAVSPAPPDDTLAQTGQSETEPESSASPESVAQTTSAATDTATVESDNTHTIEHELGSTDVPTDPQRIVSASVTMTGHLLAAGAPVVASAASQPSPLTNDDGFFAQWAEEAVAAQVQPLPGPEVDIEAIAEADPDLIIGSGFGADAVTDDIYELLSQIAPTVVFDLSGQSWQQSLSQIATASGGLERAEEVIADFDERASAAELPADQVVVAFVPSEEQNLNTFTPESAHGQLLADVGLQVQDIGDAADAAPKEGGGSRSDIVAVSLENVEEAFGDATLLGVFADQERMDAVVSGAPTLAALPAVDDGRVIGLGTASFRIDPFSADLVLDSLIEGLGAAR